MVNDTALPMTTEHPIRRETAHQLARYALFSFIVTFVVSRICVFLIMSDEMPNLYFFLHGTHVHHLNYGIFLMSAVCGYSVFRRPTGRKAEITALLYGLAMGLTFDEFGMWLHLGGSYWQRTSVDAVIVVAAVFALVAFSRSLKKLEKRHFWSFLILLVVLIGFAVVIWSAGNRLGDKVGPELHDLEAASSP
jgi:undecaprenyl pyrophosphate phosphatase UppP